MKFSNQRFFDLAPEAIQSQSEQITELRDEHYRQLVESRAAYRIVGSTALSNLNASKAPLHEDTILYPFRRPLCHMSMMQSGTLYADAKIQRSASALHDPLLDYFGDDERANYALYVGRYEPAHNGYSTWGYAAGLTLDQATANAIGREELIPFSGVKETDLVLIKKQLSEIAAFALEKNLEIIDPLTLAEGNGPIIGYEDGDF